MTREYAEEVALRLGARSLGVAEGASEGDVLSFDADGELNASPTGAFTQPVSITVADQTVGNPLSIYNDVWDTDPTDPVVSIGVSDDGFAQLYLHTNAQLGTPVIDLTNRNGRHGVQINTDFVLVGDAAPDAQLLNGQFSIGIDPTAGAAKVNFKARDLDGNIVTASINLT